MDVPFLKTRRANSGAELTRRLSERLGSRGGAPIWNMTEAWMPSPCACGETPSLECPLHGSRRWLERLMDRGGRGGGVDPASPYRAALAGGHDRAGRRPGRNLPDLPALRGAAGHPDEQAQGDPDGLAVFGRYPKGWLTHVVKLRLLGDDVGRGDILHVCSGTLGPSERWTVDVRAEARPTVVADGCHLPFRNGCVKAVMLDPPYTDAYARNFYGTENPRPSWLLREAARVVRPGGRVGFMHVVIPFSPPGCVFVGTFGISIGVGFRGRFFTLYEKRHPELFAGGYGAHHRHA